MNFLVQRIVSFRYAIKGVRDLFRTQPNALVHLLVAILVVAAGFYFQISKPEWLAVVIAITMVIAAEAANTALEYLTDLVSPDFHPLAGKAKDAAAAAVLITAIGAVAVGIIVFGGRILTLFNQL